MTPEILLELAEILKNTVFQFNESPLKQLRRTAIDTKFALPYAIMFLADLEKKISEIVRINFDQRCSNLEKRLMERGYSERMVRTHMLKARGKSRGSLLERENTRTSESKLTFNITDYPAFWNVSSILG